MCGDKNYINFRSFNVQENGEECEFFTIISIDFLLVTENKCYLKVYLENCASTIVNTKMVD